MSTPAALRADSPPPTLSALGAYEVVERDFVWARVGDLELRARSYRPNVEGRVHAAVDVHPGAWNAYDRNAGELYDRALASSGLYVLAVDFRQGPKYQHPLASRDVTAAVRWLRVHAGAERIDPDSIGLIGSSSGGHLALLAGIRPDAPEHRGTPIAREGGAFEPAPDVSAAVRWVVALWPVSDPAYRYAYAKRVGRDELVRAHDAYFGTEEAMHSASIARSVRAGEAVPLPAALVVQPGEDRNVPREMTLDLLDAWQSAGGHLEYAFYPGRPHGFAHRPGPDTDDCIALMHDFIARAIAR